MVPTSGTMPEDSDSTLRAMCLAQLAHWRGWHLSRSTIAAEFIKQNDTESSVFIFRVKDGIVSILPKPSFYKDEEFTHSDNIYLRRLRHYRTFFQNVVSDRSLNIECDFLMGVGDRLPIRTTAPIFAFQKPAGTNSALVPDIDFLVQNFYEAERYTDNFSYEEKSASAIFVGSTTGWPYHTVESIKARKNQRIRSALYFRNNPWIDFRLPNIGLCSTNSAEEMLRSLGFGTGSMSWKDHLKYKFLISMDGNGATCSRVALALKSSSVLLKYESVHQLFYFSHMIPWKHYIPIYSDRDVERIVAIERQSPGFFLEVAENGREFYKRVLSRQNCYDYMAALLRQYVDIFSWGDVATATLETAVDAVAGSDQLCGHVVAHVQNKGDVRFNMGDCIGIPGSSLCIEGFSITPDPDMDISDMSYQVIFDDDSCSDWCTGGVFCGTRGVGRPLLGFRILLSGKAATQFECQYSATFTDQQNSGLFQNGEVCEAWSPARLETIRIMIRSRRSENWDCQADP